MGHANLENISKCFVDLLYERGTVTIADVVAELERRGEKVHAGEGRLDGPMLNYSVEEVVAFLLRDHVKSPRSRSAHPVVEPDWPNLPIGTKELVDIWLADGDPGTWDASEYELLDSVPWRRTVHWKRTPKRTVPLLGYFEN
jgi:hypothetical protein